MKNKSLIPIIIVIILLLSILLFVSRNTGKNIDISSNKNQISQEGSDDIQRYMLKGYPVEQVPLFGVEKISSMKFFVNNDPLNFSRFFDKEVNYYNVVFYSSELQSEVIKYYRSLMDNVNEDGSSESSVEGQIGKYRISASHYGGDTDTVYLQVHLPKEEYSNTNPFFEDYQNLVEIHPSLIRHESSFGKLNQVGGQKEYTQYFTYNSEFVDDSGRINTISDLYDYYVDKYQSEEGFETDESNGYMSWEKKGFDITLSVKPEHNRVYLMERAPLAK